MGIFFRILWIGLSCDVDGVRLIHQALVKNDCLNTLMRILCQHGSEELQDMKIFSLLFRSQNHRLLRLCLKPGNDLPVLSDLSGEGCECLDLRKLT